MPKKLATYDNTQHESDKELYLIIDMTCASCTVIGFHVIADDKGAIKTAALQ